MGDVLVLCYHGISDTWPSPGAVPLERLEEQLDYVLARGYRGATFTEAVLSPPARRTVAVTFDDALRSIFEHAFPLLARRGLPGTLFVPTEWIDRGQALSWKGFDRWLGTEHEHELAPMSWDEIAQLAEAGWEIGSHSQVTSASVAHRRRVAGTGAARIEEGLRGADEQPCRSIAYPYGAVTPRVVAAAARAGYHTGAALPVWIHPGRALEWPRVGVYAERLQAPLPYEGEPRQAPSRGPPLRRGADPGRGAPTQRARPPLGLSHVLVELDEAVELPRRA